MSSGRIEIDTGTEQLLCAIDDGVGVITLNRPEARNALSDVLSPALRRAIKDLGKNSAVGAVLITGAGTAFCAGGDVKGMGDNSAKAAMTAEERLADLRARQRAPLRAARCRGPVPHRSTARASSHHPARENRTGPRKPHWLW